MVGFGVSSSEPSGSATIILVKFLYEWVSRSITYLFQLRDQAVYMYLCII